MSLLGWLAGLATALGLAVISGLISEEARARLDRIPYALLGLAIRRLPPEIRPDVGEEWHAELDHILHRVEAYPLTRLLYGTRFTFGLLRAAPGIGSDLISARANIPAGESSPGPAKASHTVRTAAFRRMTGAWWPTLWPSLLTGLVVTFVFTWLAGLTVAVITLVGITIYHQRAGAASSSPATARTRRRLSRLRSNRYVCLHTRAVPGTGEIIDHLVIGPAGLYVLVSQWWDPRLPTRVKSAGEELFHGPFSKAAALEHARNQAARAAELIGTETGTCISIRPGLVIYGPRLFADATPLRGVARVRGVDVFAPRETLTWLERGRDALSTADIQRLAAAASQVLPEAPPPPSQADDQLVSAQ